MANRISKAVKASRPDAFAREPGVSEKVTNFMDGVSYTLNPIETLKMVTASSVFGEPAYYRNSAFTGKYLRDATPSVRDGLARSNHEHDVFRCYDVIPEIASAPEDETTSAFMERVIDRALDYDFGATIHWAVTLRRDYYMRLNPQVIMVRAANHPKRVAYTDRHPDEFRLCEAAVMKRADEPASQLAYQIYSHGLSVSGTPNILKRAWARRLSSATPYEVAKYKNAGIGMIDTVRVSHAHSATLDVLMKTGTYAAPSEDVTWENLRSAGRSWKEILQTAKVGHMALLRNLRGIFSELDETADAALAESVLSDLVAGVGTGMQFPFRYWSAYKAVSASEEVRFKARILDTLETCMDISVSNLPRLPGKAMCLSDNSGSAWGAFSSEYGTVTVATIGNLSAVITAKQADEGYVGVFGDTLTVIPITKHMGVLEALEKVNAAGRRVGESTETGIWLFWKKALASREHWDWVFVYSDMQAGYGQLYGEDPEDYRDFSCTCLYYPGYLDVMACQLAYRRRVFPKVNVFSVQTAGYNNVVLPDYAYRCCALTGWTGKESVFAKAVTDVWDAHDAQSSKSSL